MTTTMNGSARQRKSLSEQIDRLDGILDGLAEALNESVADAVKQAVSLAVEQAVKAVLGELLTNPAVLSQIAAVAMPEVAEPQKPGLRQKLAGGWKRLKAVSQPACSQVRSTIGAGVQCVRQAARTTWARLQVLRHFQYQLLTALAVGTLVGAAAYLAAPYVAGVLSGVGGFVTAWGRSAAGRGAAAPGLPPAGECP